MPKLKLQDFGCLMRRAESLEKTLVVREIAGRRRRGRQRVRWSDSIATQFLYHYAGKELSEKTHVLTKQEIFLGKGTRVESSRVGEPRRTALPRGSQSQVLW